MKFFNINLDHEILPIVFNELVDEYNAVYFYKKESLMNTGAGRIFISSFLKLSKGNLSYEEFINNYSSTIGNKIYLCFKPEDDSKSVLNKLLILSHELTHVTQYQKEGLMFMTKYLSDSRVRAKYEAEAFSVNIEGYMYDYYLKHNSFKGFNLGNRIDNSANKLQYYGCTSEDILYAKSIMVSLLDISKQTIPIGKVFSPVLQNTIDKVRAYAW